MEGTIVSGQTGKTRSSIDGREIFGPHTKTRRNVESMSPELSVDGSWFRDEHGRAVLLRGVNLGAGSKLPNVATGGELSFIDRPFPLGDADEHYARLAHWGMNVVRLVVPWEAVEHRAPGVYDHGYLDYLAAVVAKAGDYGISVIIDPHQDVWSRASGGSGAPAWTLDLAGFDVTMLDASEAAILCRPGRLGDRSVMWQWNAFRLAACTMYTLFFAGDKLAPRTRIDGESAEKFLQNRFIAAMESVAAVVAELPNVIGFGTPNEPRPGYMGVASLDDRVSTDRGPALSWFDAMSIPAGFSRTATIREWRGGDIVDVDEVVLNPTEVSAWKSDDADIWREHGVWRVGLDGSPELLVGDYFANVRAFADAMSPFVERYAAAIRRVRPETAIFLEGAPHGSEPLAWRGARPVVNAGHWYDIAIVRTKKYDPDFAVEWGTLEHVTGPEAVQASYATQIGRCVTRSRTELDGAPTFVGEFGIPFDLDGSTAYRTNNFSIHAELLDSYYDALDANLVHAAIWNYNPDNTNVSGDDWNNEDFSIFSRDQLATAPQNYGNPDRGGRAVEGFCRPRVIAAAGVPTAQSFDRGTMTFSLTFRNDPDVAEPTVVYVPDIQYPDGFAVGVTSGQTSWDATRQQLAWIGCEADNQTLTLTPTPKSPDQSRRPNE